MIDNLRLVVSFRQSVRYVICRISVVSQLRISVTRFIVDLHCTVIIVGFFLLLRVIDMFKHSRLYFTAINNCHYKTPVNLKVKYI